MSAEFERRGQRFGLAPQRARVAQETQDTSNKIKTDVTPTLTILVVPEQTGTNWNKIIKDRAEIGEDMNIDKQWTRASVSHLATMSW